jgi:hypothetical protein
MSTKYRKAARIDQNQRTIVEALRQIPGIQVAVGHDDILVGYKGQTYWYEIKHPDCVSKKTGKVLDSKKKASQIELEKTWTGHYKIVTGLNDILADMVFNEPRPGKDEHGRD